MTESRHFKYCIIFLPSKAIKTNKLCMKLLGLHLFHIFCWIFFETCISHYGSENFQIYGKLQFLEDVLVSQNIDSRHFYLYAATAPPIPHIAPAVRTLLQVLSSPLRWPWLGILGYLYSIFYTICNFFKCDNFTVL